MLASYILSNPNNKTERATPAFVLSIPTLMAVTFRILLTHLGIDLESIILSISFSNSKAYHELR